ncbi:MAG: hypothetical protein LBQ34_05240 [Alphaproteobacteria bacterium]|jgi:hypothetical protein|nr:hypothetical protein [Alphaproteobacteria bacterium]
MLNIEINAADGLESYLVSFFNNYVKFIKDSNLPIEEFSCDLNVSHASPQEKEIIYAILNKLEFEFDILAIADNEFLTVRKVLVEG